MKKNTFIYRWMILTMLLTLFIPTVIQAQVQDITGSLTIYKYEQEEGTENVDGDGNVHEGDIAGQLLADVEFTITQTHSYNPHTDTWTAVEGIAKTFETDSDGKIVIDPIELGRYTIQETDGPAHVVLNDEVFTVDVPMTNEAGTAVNYDVHIYPKNETIRGSIDLTKYDGDTEQLLSGITFELYNADGTRAVDIDGNDIPALTTVDGKIRVDGLAYGDYYLVEVETLEGYLVKGDRIEFSINEQGQIVYETFANYKEPEVEKEVSDPAVNRGEIVTYTITVQLPSDIQDYDSFTVTDILHENLIYVAGSENSPEAFTFSQNNQTLVWDLDVSAATGGEVVITFDAKISEDAIANEPIENVATIDYDNHYDADGKTTPPVDVTPTAGSLIVHKQDGDTEQPLAGAEFELRDANGDVVATGASGDNGVVDFNGATDELDYGTYTLIEKKAPEGYSLLRNPKEITINEDTAEVSLTINNYESGWELPRTGGMGTIAFTAAGLLLMGTALFVYFRRRKQDNMTV